MLFGTPFIHHQWGSLLDVGMPPTWEKGSDLPPGTTKLGNLRDGPHSVTSPTAEPDLGFFSSVLREPTQGCQKCDRGLHRYTRWIGSLSHQTSNLSHPCNLLPKGCDPCLTWYQVQGDTGNDLPDLHQTPMVILTKKFPKRSGYMHMDKKGTQFILVILCSMRDTNIATVEGLWLIDRPNHSVPETQTTAPRFVCALLLYFLPKVAWEITVMSFYDVTLICFWSSGRKTTAHVQRRYHSLSAHPLASPPECPGTIATSEPCRLFLNLNFVPVALIYVCVKQCIYLYCLIYCF